MSKEKYTGFWVLKGHVPLASSDPVSIVQPLLRTVLIIINKAKDVKETQDPSSKTLKKTYLTVFFGEGDTAKDAKKSRERLLFVILKFKSFQSCDFLLLSAEGR